MLIKVNSQLANQMLFRVSRIEDVTVEISSDIEGFLIQQDGEDDVVGSDRRDLHLAVREILRNFRASQTPL